MPFPKLSDTIKGLRTLYTWRRNPEDPTVPLTPDLLNGYTPLQRFIDASPVGAMCYTPAFAAVKLIAETVASFPVITYKRLPDGGRTRATDVPLYTLLHDRPSDSMTPFHFWDAVVKTAINKGCCYVYIERNGAGEPANLNILENGKVRFAYNGGIKSYIYDLGGKNVVISDDDMIHVLGFTENGIVGIPMLQYAERAIRLGIASELYGERFFTKGFTLGGVIEMPNMPTPQQIDVMRRSFEALHAGLENSHSVAIVPGGGKYIAQQMSNEQAQFIELRKYQLLEIARIFRIPPHMLGSMDAATFSNIEHQSLEFIRDTIRPWLTRIEQELNRKLFGFGEYFAEFLIDDTLRGDTNSRKDYFNTALQGGWMTVNEVRRLENLPPLPGGDVLRTPLNMAPAAEKQPPQDQTDTQGEADAPASEGNP